MPFSFALDLRKAFETFEDPMTLAAPTLCDLPKDFGDFLR